MAWKSILNSAALYDEVRNIYSITTKIKTGDLEDLIDDARPGAILNFQPGQFVLTDTIEIERGDITLRGAGEERTVFSTDFGSSPEIAFLISGSSTKHKTTLAADVAQGAKVIKVADASHFQIGDVVHVSESNDYEFLNTPIPSDFLADPYYSLNVKETILDEGGLYENAKYKSQPYREGLAEITRIQGDTIYLKHAIANAMDAGDAIVRKMEPLKDVRLEGFTLVHAPHEPDPGLFKNVSKAWSEDAIHAEETYRLVIQDVTVRNAGSDGIELRGALEPVFDDVTIVGAVNKGGGGDGYGLHVGESFFGSFANLTIMDVRHALVFNSWSSEAYNDFHILETNRDINYHGGLDHSNSVIVEKSVLNYYDNDNNAWELLSTGSSTHPYTDIESNINLFGYAVGAHRDDVVHGWHTDAYLSGGDGDDLLYGGRGDDVLIGGEDDDRLYGGAGRDDLQGGDDEDFLSGGEGGDVLDGGAGDDDLWGNAGADLFKFSARRFGDDTIHDFNAAHGDALAFEADVLDDLEFQQKGANTLITVDGGDGSVLLKNVSVQVAEAAVGKAAEAPSTVPTPPPPSPPPAPPAPPPPVTNGGAANDDDEFAVWLVDTTTDQVLARVTDGATIRAPATSEGRFGISVDIPDEGSWSQLRNTVDAVRLIVDDAFATVERVAPYALFGDDGDGNFHNAKGRLSDGEHTLEVAAYGDGGVNSKPLAVAEYSFEIDII